MVSINMIGRVGQRPTLLEMPVYPGALRFATITSPTRLCTGIRERAPYELALLGASCSQLCRKESLPPRRELLSAVGLGRFGREPVRSELIAH
jgi:hypothetical protein